MPTVRLRYFASLRERAGKAEETLRTDASSIRGLYQQIAENYAFPFRPEQLRVALNGEFAAFDSSFSENDEIVFIPPVAGG